MNPSRCTLLIAAACIACTSPSPGPATPLGKSRPNVIVIITDDQGYGDLGAHGNEVIRTPNLNQLHADSVRLTDFHVDPTCAPTRSALMSGRYSTRTGVWHTIMGRSLMDGGEDTMAELFQRNGYRTGLFGKWHLGDNYPCRPQDQGFEHVVWHHGGGVGQGPDYWGNDYFDDTYEVNGEWRPFEGYCTDVWFEEASAFVEQADDQPFFAYVSTNAPHAPYLVDPSYAQPYLDAGVAPTMAKFYGMIENIDENVGRLREQLEAQGIADNTVIVFMTDNGSAAGHRVGKRELVEDGTQWPGFNAGMRGNKGSEYDGGHRVPCFVYWPDGGIEGGRDIDALSAHVDLLPTLAELTGLALPEAKPLDGQSLAGALFGTTAAPSERVLFTHSQRVENPVKWRKSAVMTDRWRLVNGEQLYDMDADPSQASDVAMAEVNVVVQLRKAYDEWWSSLEAVNAETVRIGVGGPESPVRLMSHDWHEGQGGTPWHQNHVTKGHVSNGFWALDVLEEGRYDITLTRWPHHLEEAMGAEHAAITLTYADGVVLGSNASPSVDDVSVTFQLQLKAGAVDLATLLRWPDGTEHGAYYAAIQRAAK